jgi:hypothetical protein
MAIIIIIINILTTITNFAFVHPFSLPINALPLLSMSQATPTPPCLLSPTTSLRWPEG